MGNKEKRQQRARTVKKKRHKHVPSKAAKTTVSAAVSVAATSSSSPLPPPLVMRYGSPAALEQCGPVIMGAWRVPDSLARALLQAGRPVPKMVEGLFLIDTGASRTCIAEEVAAELGLKPIGQRETHGAHGKRMNNVYEASASVFIPTAANIPGSGLHADLQVSGIPQLASGNLGMTRSDGTPARLIGLLGRDFLRNVTFTYSGAAGEIELDIQPAVRVLTSNPLKSK